MNLNNNMNMNNINPNEVDITQKIINQDNPLFLLDYFYIYI
jgi:hypothetical protein